MRIVYSMSEPYTVLLYYTHARTHAHAHTHTFNGPFSGNTQLSRYQKGKTNLDFTGARDRVAMASAGPYASLHLAPGR